MRIRDWSSDVCSSDLAEEQQVAAAFRIEREVLEPDAVMDRSGIGQGRVSIRLADGDIGDAICIGLKHRKNTFRRKPMNSCHHRRFNQSRESEGHEISLIMDKVKLACPFEHMGDMQYLPDLRIYGGIFGIRRGVHAA